METIAYDYENGDTIPQVWNKWFILYAFLLAFVSAFSAVRLLDHHTWRTEKEKQYASSVIIKHPNMVAAWILGFGTVWSMHFTGMSAVSLDGVPMCYNWPYTLLSLVCAILYIWAGVNVASYDVFAGEDRVERLKEILIRIPSVSQTKDHKSASRVINMIAFFHQLHWIVAGSVLAAIGALGMHYTGMQALRGPFCMKWKIEFLMGSVVIAVVVCFAGFWIVFRLLHWKVQQFWLRPVSAAVIAVAVCGLHFFGMLSVEYEFDDSFIDSCYDRIVTTHNDSPNAWDDHQILVAGVSVFIPTVALVVESIICRELLLAYANLKDPSLTSHLLLAESNDSNNNKSNINLSKHTSKMLNNLSKETSKMPNVNLSHETSAVLNGMSKNDTKQLDPENQVSTIAVIDKLIGLEKEGYRTVPSAA